VRASVKPIIPIAYARIEARYYLRLTQQVHGKDLGVLCTLAVKQFFYFLPELMGFHGITWEIVGFHGGWAALVTASANMPMPPSFVVSKISLC
jgi:hypothetical protein